MDAPVSRLRFVPFEIPTAVTQPPEGDEWIHEVKFDGYRTQLIIERRQIRAYSRRGLDWTDRYPGVIKAAASPQRRGSEELPLIERKQSLRELLPDDGLGIQFSDVEAGQILRARAATYRAKRVSYNDSASCHS